MKILVIQDRLRSGGTERNSVFLTKAFAQQGHQARLLTFRPGGTLWESAASVVETPLQMIDTGLDWFAPGLFNRVSEFKPQIVVAMGRMANCYAGFLQTRFPGITVLSTMRTGKALPWLYRRSLKKTRHVVANSQQAAACLVEVYGVAPERISVIHNSVIFAPRPRFETGSHHHTLREEQGAGRNTVVLLCTAMFRREKNHKELIEVAATLPRNVDWQLWLGGDGPELGPCRNLATTLGIGERVKFLGFLKDPVAVYRAADLALLTSKKESLSNFLIEAQAHGLPAVAYAAQGVEECIADGETGHVVPMGDQDRFVRHVIALLADRDERLRFAAASRIRAQHTFSAERQVSAYLSLFEQLQKPGQAGI